MLERISKEQTSTDYTEVKPSGEVDPILFLKLHRTISRLMSRGEVGADLIGLENREVRELRGGNDFLKVTRYAEPSYRGTANALQTYYPDLDIERSGIVCAAEFISEHGATSFSGTIHMLTGNRILAVASSEAQTLEDLFSPDASKCFTFAESLGLASAWDDNKNAAFNSNGDVSSSRNVIVEYNDQMAQILLAGLGSFEGQA